MIVIIFFIARLWFEVDGRRRECMLILQLQSYDLILILILLRSYFDLILILLYTIQYERKEKKLVVDKFTPNQ